MKRYYRGGYSVVGGIAVVLSFITIAILPTDVYASKTYTVPVPTINQHLSVPDTNGNTGYYDCMVASVAMVLQSLAGQKLIAADEASLSYDAIRYYTRTYYPDYSKGITLSEAVTIIPDLSDNTVTASFVQFDRQKWPAMLRRQLLAGYPVIVYVTDWSYLPNHASHGSAAHVVVISGLSENTISYSDPWDGRTYNISHAIFANAWSVGYYSYRALVFEPAQKATTFDEILRRKQI